MGECLLVCMCHAPCPRTLHSDCIWRVSGTITIQSGGASVTVSTGDMPQWVFNLLYDEVNVLIKIWLNCRFLLSEKTSYHFKNYGAQDATSQWVEQQSFINNNNNNSRSKGSKWHQLNSLVVERQEHHQNISLQPHRVSDQGEAYEEQARGLSLLPSRRLRRVEDKLEPFELLTEKKDTHEEKDVEAEKYNHKVTKTKQRNNNHSSSLFGPIGPKRSGHASLGNFLRDSYQNENIR